MLHALSKLRGNICPQKRENRDFPSLGQAGAQLRHLGYDVMDTEYTLKEKRIRVYGSILNA